MDCRLQGLDALNKQIADLKSAAEWSVTATFRIGIVISLIFIAITVYMTIQGFMELGADRDLYGLPAVALAKAGASSTRS